MKFIEKNVQFPNKQLTKTIIRMQAEILNDEYTRHDTRKRERAISNDRRSDF
jgi:hypothetical protein